MMDAAVVDASIAVKWVVNEPDSAQARRVSGIRLHAPDLLFLECANILWKKVRLGDLSRQEAAPRLAVLLRCPVQIVPGQDLLESALNLSLDLDHPVYDCVYLALALRRKIPLITADTRFAAAVRRKRNFARFVQPLGEIGPS